MYSTRLADHIPEAIVVPECRILGGGMLAIAFRSETGGNATVTIHDRFGNSCTAQVVDRTERTRAANSIDTLPSEHHNGSPSEATPRAMPSDVRMVVRMPDGCLDEGFGELEVSVHGLSEPLIFCLAAPNAAARATVSSISLDHNLLLLEGRIGDDRLTELPYGLFVDGKLSSAGSIGANRRSFLASISVNREHFDGAIHLLEIRDLSAMTVLASIYQRLPMHMTPWHALQEHARIPLDATLSPAARHHFRSYMLWFDRIARKDGFVPPLNLLHSEILAGHRKRQVYPFLSFPVCDRPDVSVIVPAHNRFELTYLCFCSLLFAYNDASFEVILVDDGSADETSHAEDFVGGIRVLRHRSCRGFVDSCKDAAALAKGEFVAFLNNDTEVTARWLDELILACRSFDNVGLVGSKLVYPDDKLQEAGGIIWKSGNPWNVGRGGNAHDPRYNYLREVDYVSGAAMLLPRHVWNEVQGFSAEFAPGYFEDTDLAMKIRAAGYRVLYAPTSTVVHFEGQTAGTNTSSGMKRFQEINRPKFRKKWAEAIAGHGLEGREPDREKDRKAALRVLFLDHQFPQVDADAGSYSAFQEIRLFQKIGAKVTFMPRNLAWLDRHTLALQRMGVECLYAPYVRNFSEFIRSHSREFDAVFICRHQIAEEAIPLLRAHAPSTRILFNLADLHFLRELREVEAGTPGYTRLRAYETRSTELAVVASADLAFSYSQVELDLLRQNLGDRAKTARMPWIVEARRQIGPPFPERSNLLFLGGFGHPPNAQAVRYFVRDIMPGLRRELPGVKLEIAGSGSGAAFRDNRADDVVVLGHVAELDLLMDRHRVFVAPLKTGAGLKGKVIEAIARGLPCVLSTIAAEGTDLVDGESCLIADTPAKWIDRIAMLYTDDQLWSRIASNALAVAQTRYSFDNGVVEFAEALSRAGLPDKPRDGLVYRHVRPLHYGM